MSRGTIRYLSALLYNLTYAIQSPEVIKQTAELVKLKSELPVNGWRPPYPVKKISQKKKRIHWARTNQRSKTK